MSVCGSTPCSSRRLRSASAESFPPLHDNASATDSLTSGPGDLDAGAPLVALEHPPELGAHGERDENVADGVREVKRQSTAHLRQECRLRVRKERVPLPKVHESAEGHAEDKAGRGERDPIAEKRCQESSDETAGSPAEHLPRRPYALPEEEVGREGGKRPCREAAPRAEGDAGDQDDYGHRLHARD